MKRIQWYFARGRAMSVREVVHRLRELAVKQLSRFLAPKVDAGVLSWTGNSKPLGDLMVTSWSDDSELRANWRRESNMAMRNGPLIFGTRWPLSDGIPQWQAALPGESSWPLKYCFDVNYRSPEVNGEVRLAWELNRLFWLIPMAATAALENDGILADWCSSNITSWDESNPPFLGIGWASGIECAMQIFALATIEDLLSRVAPDQTRQAGISACISLRAKWIRRFPSRYSSANNHSLAELAGRLVAALVVAEEDSNEDPRKLLLAFENEYHNQHCMDGMNREHAPHYGLFVLEVAALCTEVCRHAGLEVEESWQKSMQDSALILNLLQDDGGNLLCFGDNDGSGLLSSCIAHNQQVDWVIELTGISLDAKTNLNSVEALGENWYTVCRSDDVWGRSMWTIDHAPLGYGSLAAHGHADTLSVWLSVDDRPVFVESGTFIYHSDDAWRTIFRSTAVHNTITIEKRSSSEMNGAFNWWRNKRAEGRLRSIDRGEDWVVEAEHDGYLRDFGARHIRMIRRSGNGHFVIEDRLESADLLDMQFSLMLAPDIESIPRKDGWFLDRDGRPLGSIRFFGEFVHTSVRGDSETGQGWFSDIFMSKTPTTQLLINGKLGNSRVLKVEISAEASSATR